MNDVPFWYSVVKHQKILMLSLWVFLRVKCIYQFSEDIIKKISEGIIPIPHCEEVERIELRRKNEQEAVVLEGQCCQHTQFWELTISQ